MTRTSPSRVSIIVTMALMLAAAPAGADVRASPATRLTWKDLGPVFEDPRALEALDLIRAGRADAALERLRPLAYGHARPQHLERLRFLIAHAAVQAGDCETALFALDGLEAFLPLVADHVRFLRGRCLAAAGRHAEALDVLQAIPSGSPVYGRARYVMGESFTALGRPAEAAQAYQAVFDAGRRDPDVAGRLARSLDAVGRRDEAIALLRRLYFRAVREGKTAYAKVIQMLGGSVAPTEADRLAQATAYLDVHASQDAIREAQPLTKSRDPKIRCEALFVQARALAKLRRHSEAWPLFQRVVTECKDRVDLAAALFHAIRSALRSGHDAEVERLAEDLRTRFPAATYNDDVAVWRARVALKAGDRARAEAILERSLNAWPDGDMALESAWLLAWGAFSHSDYRNALKRLEAGRNLAQKARNPAYGSRFAYWTARALGLSGRKKESRAAFEACVRDFPMTYYAHLCLARLSGRKASPAKVFERVVSKTPPPLGPFFTPSSPSALREGPLARALWFVQTGLTEFALEELAASGSASADEAWLRVILSHGAGDVRRAHRMAAGLLAETGGFWPDDATADYYRIAYPRPFANEVAAAARESSVDPWLLFALMREESAFNPDVESHANAIGLMQLILPTAREMGKALKLAVTPETLRRPEVNVRLGARYISRLLQRFHHPLLAIPGYNAGGAAISRWLNENPHVPLDRFVEDIAAEETRNYARKVFESYAAYRFLYGQGSDRFLPLTLER